LAKAIALALVILEPAMQRIIAELRFAEVGQVVLPAY
jgi:hypothetical protein